MAGNDNENELDAQLREALAKLSRVGGKPDSGRAHGVEHAAKVVRVVMPYLTPESRVALLETLFDGYCRHCGEHVGDRICHCTNDE